MIQTFKRQSSSRRQEQLQCEAEVLTQVEMTVLSLQVIVDIAIIDDDALLQFLQWGPLRWMLQFNGAFV